MLEFQIRLPAFGRGGIAFRVDPWNPRLRVGIPDRSRNYSFFMTSGLLVQDELEPAPVPLNRLVASSCSSFRQRSARSRTPTLLGRTEESRNWRRPPDDLAWSASSNPAVPAE